MRYLRGGSVREALESGPCELQATSELLDQIASAFDFAHRHGVIHRDIKPGNILRDDDGYAYLADFGIAKDLVQTNDRQTAANAVVGSADYISPEQARSEPGTARADNYSLGVTLFEMITGEHPFKNASAVERLYNHINNSLPKINNLANWKQRSFVSLPIKPAICANNYTALVFSTAYSADGRWIASAGQDQTIQVWNALEGKHLWTLQPENQSIIWQNMSFSPDRSLLAVGLDNGQIVLWHMPGSRANAAAELQIAWQVQHNNGWTASPNFSPDGNILAVPGLERVSLYDAQTGELIINFNHPSGASDAVISPDGRIVATAGRDGFVRLMAANLDELLIVAQSRLTRSMTTAECQQYLHVEECPGDV